MTFGPETRYAGLDAHITFIDVNGNVVGSHTAPYVPNGTVRFVYPGATVDAAGNATDWPGWKLAPNGNWIPDSSDQHLREGLTVRVEVNPTAESKVSYPPETSGCASPPHDTLVSTLPSTGTDLSGGVAAGGVVALALGALAIGTDPPTGTSALIQRRRRSRRGPAAGTSPGHRSRSSRARYVVRWHREWRRRSGPCAPRGCIPAAT